MSLLRWEPFRPSRVFDYGFENDDFWSMTPWERRLWYRKPWEDYRHPATVVKEDQDKFQVDVDVQEYRPDEIKVISSGNTLTIEGKHEEKKLDNTYVTKKFVRKYELPLSHDLTRVTSRLSSDGVLSVTAPKKYKGFDYQRTVPILRTGKPLRAVTFK